MSDDPLVLAGSLLAAQDPKVWQRLGADHAADPSGHCRTCRGPSGAPPVSPCRLSVIAEEAERQSRRRR